MTTYSRENKTPKNIIPTQWEQLPQATRVRIAHIDFTLLFKGEAVGADLVDHYRAASCIKLLTQAQNEYPNQGCGESDNFLAAKRFF
jgi:hypothetical protein